MLVFVLLEGRNLPVQINSENTVDNAVQNNLGLVFNFRLHR